MCVELGSNSLDNGDDVGICAGRKSSPPFICYSTTRKDDNGAQYVIVAPLIQVSFMVERIYYTNAGLHRECKRRKASSRKINQSPASGEGRKVGGRGFESI